MPIYFRKEKVKSQLKNYMPMDKFPEIKGYNFEQMVEEKKRGNLKIWMSFTGNMISSGNREIIKYLIKNNIIDGITTTAAAVEEDIIKCIRPFHLGSFDIQGKFLFDECVGRIGNILVPYDRYAHFERFFNDLFKEIIGKNGSVSSVSDITREVGLYIKEHELTKEKC